MSTTQLPYNQFYKKYGVRFLTNMKNPKLHDYSELVLPRESILHWVDYDGKYVVGPTQDEPLIARTGNRIYVEAIDKYPGKVKGGWVLAKNNNMSLVTKYDSQNPNIKRMTKMVNEYTTVDVLPMYTYGLLTVSYRYKRYVDSELNRWYNYHYTILQTALYAAKVSRRQQFIELDVPKRYPSLQNIKKGVSGIDITNIRYLPLKDHWLIVVLWNLVARNGNDFVFSDYELKDFDKINIIWKADNKFTVMNLGTMLNFAYADKPQITTVRLQHRLIQMFITLNSLNENQEKIDEELTDQIDKFSNDDDDTPEEETDNINEDDVEDIEMINPFKVKIPLKTEVATNTDVSKNFVNPNNIVLDDDDGHEEDSGDDEFLQALEVVADDNDIEDTGYKAYIPKSVAPDSVIEEDGSRLVKAGIMAVGTFDRFKKLAREAGNLSDPLNPNLTINEASAITEEDVNIDEVNLLPISSNDILDQSMISSSLSKFNEQYIENVYHKDVLNAVMRIQRGGLVIKDYQIDKIETVNDKYNVHKVQIETLKGHVSTLSFKVPVIETDGTFKSGGSRRFMRKQRGDVPIRKINYNSVALTSYYSKMFVNRSERKQFDFDNFISNYVISSDGDRPHPITDVKFGNVFDGEYKLPKIYTTLARKFISFVCRGNTLYFNINNLSTNFNERLRRGDVIPLGKDSKTGVTSLYLTKGPNPTLLDGTGKDIDMTLETYLGIDLSNAPLEYAEVNIFGRNIPLVLLLAHHIGFGNLLKTLNVKPRREARNKRIILSEGEYAIKFHDEVLIFNRNYNKKANLIVNGLLRFKNIINTISVYDLDSKSIYNDLFEDIKAPLKLLKESKDMYNLWIDPITEKILLDMNEPTDLVLLFIRAAELLLLDEHPDSMDITYMRDKGYERISGMIYSELIKAVRDYNTKSIYSNNKLTINPESIWYSIITDQTMSPVEDSNPIHNMKEKETIIYSGQGGRSGQTMTAASRKYHKSNLGITSEATVDSGDTGTIVYNVADPNYTTVYGTSRRVKDVNDLGGAKILSPSALLAPGGEYDDPKRLNFTSTQNSQTTYSAAASPMPLRTGMEKVIHARAGDMFSKIAKDEGVVIDKTDTTLLVEYKDGTREGFTTGRVFGKWSGYNIPHQITANFNKGDKFKKGDCIYYNDNYFTKDVTDNNSIIFKNHVLARTAFVENYDVYEDSAAMSKEFSTKLTTGLTHVRNIKLNSTNTVKNLVSVGDVVEGDSILCTIHSSQLDDSFFSEDTVSSLQSLSSLNPKAEYAGTIEKINIIYTADLENLSEELADIIRASDARLYRESKRTNKNIKNGRVDIGFKIDGVDLTSDDVVIQVYVTETIGMSIADKIVVANQLKATVGRYWNTPQTSEDGEPLDLFFSAKSVDNRVVLSAEHMGSTNTLLIELTKRFIESYDK